MTGIGTGVATIIVEPRLLVREAIQSLMESHSYRVICGVGSTANLVNPSIVSDGPVLVIIGAQSADISVTEASGVRALWPDSKIVLLFEHASPADFQKLLTSQIDGCVPLSAFPEMLIDTLDMIMTGNVRVMLASDAQSRVAEHESISMPMAGMQHHQPVVSGANTSDPNLGNADTVPTIRNRPRLTEREIQILVGLVKGQANKVIARTCNITEATVKVHMKSILRKIQVANRTQAAIWALQHGYPGDEMKDRSLKAIVRSQDAASIH